MGTCGNKPLTVPLISYSKASGLNFVGDRHFFQLICDSQSKSYIMHLNNIFFNFLTALDGIPTHSCINYLLLLLSK